MRLTKVTIEGFRSIKQRIEVPIDKAVTVLLGANDHGKTNLLDAIRTLNDDYEITASADLNWDRSGKDTELPFIEFVFDLEPSESESCTDAIMEQLVFESLDPLLEELEAEYGELHETWSTGDSSSVDATTDGEKAQNDEAIQGDVTDLESVLTLLKSDLPLVPALKDLKGYLQLQSEQIDREIKSARAMASENGANRVGEGDDSTADDPDEAANTETANLSELLRKDEQREALQHLQTSESGCRRLSAILASATSSYVPAAEPNVLTVRRQGCGLRRTIHFGDYSYLADELPTIAALIPRVEKIEPIHHIPDATTEEDIGSTQHEFLRGIFHYAGLDKSEWPKLFTADDYTRRTLRNASRRLNEVLRQEWTQGTELEFELSHSATDDAIDFSIIDPSIADRYTRASQRSSGFTHFFATKTVLYARQQEAPANAYIWLFDEPGIYLHAAGQADLLRVLERISSTHQIAYTTHSLWMLNRNFPHRHRLIYKDDTGTRLDMKPYLGMWRTAVDSIGFALPSTILFATRCLIVEGSSDVTYTWSLLRKAAQLGILDVDLNDLAIIAASDCQEAVALVRMLTAGGNGPALALLTDDDRGGNDRYKCVQKALGEGMVKHISMQKRKSIEDILPELDDLYVRAVWKQALDAGSTVDEATLASDLEQAWKVRTVSAAEWGRKEAANMANVPGALSAMGIARHYSELLAELPVSEELRKNFKIAHPLIDKIRTTLNLPRRIVEQERIVE